jgi:ABC-type Zn uptake system ZnuABC Zn-binding protein ZnuA
MGDVHPYGNPHYWTDPDNGRIIARTIAKKLSDLDPAHAADFAKNLAAFEARLAEKDKEWLAKMAPYAGAKIVTFHDSWPNFAKHFKLVVAGHIEPKPGIPPSPSHTLEMINLIQSAKIRAILVEPYFDLKTPKFIAGKTGAVVVSGYPSVGGIPEIKDYFALFDTDLEALARALGSQAP